ncbi:PEP-CTERM sorting domain-containing protein [Pseudoduganella sp. FT55W]|uniref:PEP-CTERM sorting domain-containing protein n=1 Tax=Duganella rivi TaxID=2666083 RepID=A0A7X4KB60_9BURK|nr:NF038120 family PEP-CTERM protein [Duganella rivi]MYM67791.1 PEP-CTERM sorting domain-containing protein [Duganella rivi]
MNRLFRYSKLASRIALACSAIAALPSSHAGTIDFETVANVVTPVLAAEDTIYAGRDQFLTGGFLATVSDSNFAQGQPDYEPGLAGAVLTNSVSCTLNACPYDNTHFFAGLNGGSLALERQDGVAFQLSSLNYGFIARDWELPPLVYGRLTVQATLAGGSVITLEHDMPAEIGMMGSWDLSAELGAQALSHVTFSACVFDDAGACVNDDTTLNLAQFALDDIQVSAVPEPAAAPLLLAGLGLLGAWRRRGKAAAAAMAGGAA